MKYAVSTSDVGIETDEAALLKRLAQLCKTRAIASDADWDAAVGVLFNATNASGLTATTRTFMIEFFRQFIKVSPPG
jgi:hypothetical protein